MDNTILEQSMNQQYTMYIVMLVVATIAVLILLGIVLSQNNKIKSLETPSYGFLGKPLFTFGFLALSIAMAGGVFYLANKPAAIEETQANKTVQVKINYVPTSSSLQTYIFNAVPYVNGTAWGNSETFDVYWSFTNNGVETELESSLSQTRLGGITRKLDKGINVIKATIFYEGNSYYAETQITIQ